MSAIGSRPRASRETRARLDAAGHPRYSRLSPGAVAPAFAVFPAPAVAVVLAALAALAVGAAPARADVGATIIERCTNGQSLSGFSQQAYGKALQEMPAEVSEYSDCVNLIHKAELAAAGGQGAGIAAGGQGALTANVAPPTPAEQQVLQSAHRGAAAPVRIDGQTVDPGVVHANIASAVSSLPTPLLALLALLGACALAILARAIRDRVRAGRPR